MAAICDAAIHLCAVRVTRLDALGVPSGSPNNVYVTDKPMVVNVRPEIEAGEDRTLVGGCDCIIAQYRGFDKLKRFTLEMDLGVLEPGLIEMMTGATPIFGGTVDEPIGLSWPVQADCGSPAQPNVAFEGWQDLWEGDHQASVYPYVRWVFPSSYWQIGDLTLQNDFNQPRLTGFTRGNTNWGMGIYGDMTEEIGAFGGFVYDTSRPTASCGYQSHAAT